MCITHRRRGVVSTVRALQIGNGAVSVSPCVSHGFSRSAADRLLGWRGEVAADGAETAHAAHHWRDAGYRYYSVTAPVRNTTFSLGIYLPIYLSIYLKLFSCACP